MPRKPTKGKVQLAAELSADVVAAFRAFAAGRGEKLSATLEEAMRRHMTYPPPPPAPPRPLSPLPDAAPPKRRGKP